MTQTAPEGGFSPAGAGMPGDLSPEQRIGEWDVDAAGADATAAAFAPVEPAELGVEPAELGDDDLIRELHSLHRTRLDTLRHAADAALANHLRRTADLETEYLARHPDREVDSRRLRDGGAA